MVKKSGKGSGWGQGVKVCSQRGANDEAGRAGWLFFIRVKIAFGGKAEGIALAVIEKGVGAPCLRGGGFDKFDTPGGEFLVGFLDVNGKKTHIYETADAVFLTGRGEEGDTGLSARDGKGDPALFVVKGDVGDDLKAELRGVKPKCAILIGDGDAYEFDFADHEGK